MSQPPEDQTVGHVTSSGATATPQPLSATVNTPPASAPAASDAHAGNGITSAKDKAIQTRDEATDAAADVKDRAVDAGTHVAEVAKDQAASVAAEAGQHVKDLLSQSRDELTSQVGGQQQRLAGGLHSLSEELHSMAQGNAQSGIASELVREAGTRSKSVASWLESREPGDVVSEVKAFARRRPGLFIALAGGAGLLVGRLARGLRDDAMPNQNAAITPAHADLHPDSDIYAEPVSYSDTALLDVGPTASGALR